jgi:hypothetical protein
MRRWQFDALWGVAFAGLIFLPIASNFGIDVDPATLPSFGALLAFVLTQRKEWTKDPKEKDEEKSEESA